MIEASNCGASSHLYIIVYSCLRYIIHKVSTGIPYSSDTGPKFSEMTMKIMVHLNIQCRTKIFSIMFGILLRICACEFYSCICVYVLYVLY